MVTCTLNTTPSNFKILVLKHRPSFNFFFNSRPKSLGYQIKKYIKLMLKQSLHSLTNAQFYIRISFALNKSSINPLCEGRSLSKHSF